MRTLQGIAFLIPGQIWSNLIEAICNRSDYPLGLCDHQHTFKLIPMFNVFRP